MKHCPECGKKIMPWFNYCYKHKDYDKPMVEINLTEIYKKLPIAGKLAVIFLIPAIILYLYILIFESTGELRGPVALLLIPVGIAIILSGGEQLSLPTGLFIGIIFWFGLVYLITLAIVNQIIKNRKEEKEKGTTIKLNPTTTKWIPPSTITTTIKEPTFEEGVEAKKTIPTNAGIKVCSQGEKLITNFLHKHKIDFDHDKQITLKGIEKNKKGYDTSWVRPDFYLNEFNIVIEYWGMKGTKDYDKQMEWKKRVYKESKTPFISLEPKDLEGIENILKIKLERKGCKL